MRVQGRDARRRQAQQFRILRQGFFSGIAKVGQQGEVQIGFSIGQKAHFQRLDQMLDVLQAGQQRRHHHQGAVLRRDAGGKIHPWQRTRRCHQSGQPVHQRGRQLTCGKQRQHADQRQHPETDPAQPGLRQQPGAKQQGQQRNRTQIQQQRSPAGPSPQPGAERWMRTTYPFQFLATAIDQVITDVGFAVMPAQTGRARPRKINGAGGHMFLNQTAGSGNRFNHMAVAVTAGEIHPGISCGRVVAQRAVDHTHRLDKLAPVEGAQQAQATDAVTD